MKPDSLPLAPTFRSSKRDGFENFVEGRRSQLTITNNEQNNYSLRETKWLGVKGVIFQNDEI